MDVSNSYLEKKVKEDIITCLKCHEPLTTRVNIASIIKLVLPVEKEEIKL